MRKKVAELWKKVNDAGKEVVSLRDKIKSGEESLGSNFDNFVFCKVGVNPKSWKPFYDLRKKVNGVEKDEDLLIVNSRLSSSGFHAEYFSGCDSNGLGPRVDCETYLHKINYGVLNGNKIDFDLKSDEIIFPTGEKYIDACVSSFLGSYALESFVSESIDVKGGKMRKNVSDLSHLFLPLSLEKMFGLSYCPQIQLLVGSEVDEYFDKISNGKRVYSEIKNRLKFS